MEPKFVTRPAFTIVGMAYCGKNENEEIPQLWQEFTPRGPEIRARRETGHAYGVIYGFDDESGVMDYLAGIEVAEAGDLPQGMIALDLPHKTYAVFECTLPTLMQPMARFTARGCQIRGIAGQKGLNSSSTTSVSTRHGRTRSTPFSSP